MAAYLVALGRVDDTDRFAKYLEAVGPTLGPHGGRLLGVEDPAEVVEGEASHPRVVLVEFPSKEHARAWKHSPDYRAIVAHRHASSDHVLYLIDAFVPPTA